MKKHVIFIFISLFLIQCTSSDMEKTQIEQNEIANKKTHISRDETYYYESNQVFNNIFDTWKMDSVLIFDTLSYWNVLKDDMVLNVLYNIDTSFIKEERVSILNDYKIHKYSDIKKMIPYKYHSKYLLKIDYAGVNTTKYTLPHKRNYIIMMFYPPMFTDSFNKCLIMFIDIQKEKVGGIDELEGYFVYLEKDKKGHWQDLKVILAPDEMFDSIRTKR